MTFMKRTGSFVGSLYCKALLFIVAVLMFGIQGFSQEPSEIHLPQSTVTHIDLIEVIGRAFNKNKPARSDSLIEGVKYLSFLPIIGYGPANGFILGAAVSVTDVLGDKRTTKLSSALMGLTVTSQQQVLLSARSAIYLPGDKWFFPGDFRLWIFAQPTYGLGIYGLNSEVNFSLNGVETSKTIQAQPMRFNYIRFYETAVRKISSKWYAGMGINLDGHANIQDQSLDTANQKITSNYYYSAKYGFSPTHYSTNGVTLNLIMNSRDNPVNAFKGGYINLSFRVNQKLLGSSQNSTMLYAEGRNYIPLKKSKPGFVLAFWTWGVFVTSGNVPYLALPAIGWDTYGRSGRGYIQGRLRGLNMVYGETECRMPISRNGLFGIVAFLNVTTASNPITEQKLFNSVAPGYGVGLRIKMNKVDRTNICIDYGVGQSSSGIYFSIQEAF